VIGVDIAPRVLAVARTRTAHLPQVTLLQEDAAGLTLSDQRIDGIFSRFGTMFFAEPAMAFANMRRMLACSGKIGFVCWRSMHENELDFFPVEAAGLASMVDPTPFSFDDADTIRRVLDAARYARIEIVARDTQVSSGDTDAMLMVVTRVGALGKVLREAPALFRNAETKIRNALSARERDGQVSLGASTWVVTATAD
jgi:hypothetical protein